MAMAPYEIARQTKIFIQAMTGDNYEESLPQWRYTIINSTSQRQCVMEASFKINNDYDPLMVSRAVRAELGLNIAISNDFAGQDHNLYFRVYLPENPN